MQIQRGLVKYKDRSDIICTYGIADDGKQYYFLGEGKLDNGNIIVTTTLLEAVDPLATASHVGVIDSNGNVIIPCENKTIKKVSNDMLLVEVAKPFTESVIQSIRLREDPLSATKLVTTPATIKEKISAKMGSKGNFVFNDQFSEATICNLDGQNLINNQYYSFIGVTKDMLYLSKNTVDSEIVEYSLAPLNDDTESLEEDNTQPIASSDVYEESTQFSDPLSDELASDTSDSVPYSEDSEVDTDGLIPSIDESAGSDESDAYSEDDENVVSTEEIDSVVNNNNNIDENAETEEDLDDIEEEDIDEGRENIVVPEVKDESKYSDKDEDYSYDKSMMYDDYDYDYDTDRDSSYYNDYNYSSNSIDTSHRNFMDDVTKTISNLVELNRNLQSMVDDYERKLNKCSASRKKFLDLSKEQAREITSLKAKVARLESDKQLLENKIAALSPSSQGDLVRVLNDAQSILGNSQNRIRKKQNNY